MIREALAGSELFVEGTEYFTKDKPVNSYYGFNVTKTEREPLDQIHAFFAAKRIQEQNEKMYGTFGNFHPFVAGIFEVLNAKNPPEAQKIVDINSKKDAKKKELFQKMMDRYDIKGNVFLTQDLWKNPKYWDYFEEPFERGEYTREKLERDALKFYDNNISKLRGVATVKQIPSEIISLTPRTKARIENWSAAIIYVPAEVAESVFFSRENGVNLKIGHVEERIYDKYINGLMDVAHLRQPADLASKRLEPKTVTPYIDKHRIVNQTRIFFNDTAKDIRERVQNIPAEEYSYTIDPKIGELLNPFMEKVIYAVESARILGKTPVKINNAELNEGRDVVKGFENGSFNMEQLKWEMPTLVEEYITKQFHY